MHGGGPASSGFSMYPVLKFNGSVKHDAGIDAWFADRPGELSSIAEKWFLVMRNCGPDVRELIHDGCPTACVEDAPFAYVNVFRAHVNTGFFHGAALSDPMQILEGNGKYMRHVKLKPGSLPDEVALEALIVNAYVDIKWRLDAEKRL